MLRSLRWSDVQVGARIFDCNLCIRSLRWSDVEVGARIFDCNLCFRKKKYLTAIKGWSDGIIGLRGSTNLKGRSVHVGEVLIRSGSPEKRGRREMAPASLSRIAAAPTARLRRVVTETAPMQVVVDAPLFLTRLLSVTMGRPDVD